MKVTILEHPEEKDWIAVKQRALITVDKKLKPDSVVTDEWKVKALKSGHSIIRRLRFSFLIEDLPSWVSVHLVRHVHAQPYVMSQRNDRQKNYDPEYDRNKEPQDSPVKMIWDMNADELINIAHKRLCHQASKETREVVEEICRQIIELNPEFKEVLVPLCAYRNGLCTEFYPCGLYKLYQNNNKEK